MTDLIGTIASDDEIDYNDDSEDDFAEKIHTKKDREASGYVHKLEEHFTFILRSYIGEILLFCDYM